ncbi:DUF5320 domain-containing protein [Patescibacteria group bacterium]|nr:DUF5320 domain-containing protein [Patescibacteria group bacterium]
MPKFNKKGPQGKGPGTGRGLGSCDLDTDLDQNSGFGFGPCGFGLGWRRRFGAGRGMGKYFSCFNLPQTKDDQIKVLADYKKALKEELEDVKKEEKELSEE